MVQLLGPIVFQVFFCINIEYDRKPNVEDCCFYEIFNLKLPIILMGFTLKRKASI